MGGVSYFHLNNSLYNKGLFNFNFPVSAQTIDRKLHLEIQFSFLMVG